jgi:phytoene dehydrogenase-like protein
MDEWDAVVIGGGFNGLVAAATLARSGARALVLESNAQLGGAASNRPLRAGLEYSAGAHWLGMTIEPVRTVLAEAFDSVETVPCEPLGVLLEPGREGLVLSSDPARTLASLRRRFGERATDALTAFEAFASDLNGATEVLHACYRNPIATQSDLQAGLRKTVDAATARAFSEGSLLDATRKLEGFELLRASLLASSLSLSNAPPAVPGTGICAAHMNLAQFRGERGTWGLIRGGMGTLIKAIARLCASYGVTLRTGCRVHRIVHEGKGCRLALEDGSFAVAKCALYSGHVGLLPEIDLLPPEGLPPAEWVTPHEGTGAVVILELSGVPEYVAANGLVDTIFTICPSLAYIESAWSTFRADGSSGLPLITLSFETRAGCCLMYAFVQFVKYTQVEVENVGLRDHIVSSTVRVLSEVFRDIVALKTACHGFTPRDLETSLGLHRGHPEHSHVTMPYHFERRRPFGGAIGKVVLCGASIYPGGNLTGLPGYHGAQRAMAMIAHSG